MKTLLISNIRALSTAPDKQTFADDMFTRLKAIAKEKKGRLGRKYELVNNDSIKLTIAQDVLLPVLKDAVERAGMKIAETTAVDSFVAMYRENESQ
jgi:hypothetical protein